jgi:UDP:flavonoid glycosyltransferase YjiC (YdhE family)
MTAPHRNILFVTLPGYGHALPIVNIAWALRAAGHDVRIATCGISLRIVTQAGLQAVDVAPGADLMGIYRQFKHTFKDCFQTVSSQPIETVFSVLGNLTVDNVITVARSWRADLIIYTPEAFAAPVAAASLRIPGVFMSLGLAHTPKPMLERTNSYMTRACERHDVTDFRTAAWIDVAPPSFRMTPLGGLPMRYLPFTGGGLLDTRFENRGKLPRIAVTTGTVIPLVFGMSPLRWVADIASQLDVEFVVAHGTRESCELGLLPPNVRLAGWIPFDQLLPMCDGVIHHGGPGTSLLALRSGLPQIVLPEGADQFQNADILKRQGVAITSNATDMSVDLVRSLLTDEGMREAARQVSEEMKLMPSPAEVALRITELAI